MKNTRNMTKCIELSSILAIVITPQNDSRAAPSRSYHESCEGGKTLSVCHAVTTSPPAMTILQLTIRRKCLFTNMNPVMMDRIKTNVSEGWLSSHLARSMDNMAVSSVIKVNSTVIHSFCIHTQNEGRFVLFIFDGTPPNLYVITDYSPNMSGDDTCLLSSILAISSSFRTIYT